MQNILRNWCYVLIFLTFYAKIKLEVVIVKKGQTRRIWTPEQKAEIVHKGHQGNHFAALHVSKNLSEVERLRVMVAKLEIENERLKKIS